MVPTSLMRISAKHSSQIAKLHQVVVGSPFSFYSPVLKINTHFIFSDLITIS